MMAPVFQQCESHPGRPLSDHLVDVADRLENARTKGSCLRSVGLFHDLGKATSYFQAYLNPHQPPPPPQLKQHSELGALWLLEHLRSRLESDSISAIDVALSFLFVKRHHGRLDDLLDGIASPDADDRSRVANQLAAMDVISIQRWLKEQTGMEVSVPCPDGGFLRDLVFQIKTGPCSRKLLAAMSEFDAMARFQNALREFGSLIEADRDSAAGFSRSHFEAKSSLQSEHVARFRSAGQFGATAHGQLSDARNLVYESAIAHAAREPTGNGRLWTLTVPTGAAKTLAALGWALKRREARVAAGQSHWPIIYALPFTSIIDQNADVIRRVWGELADESQLAIHHHLAEPGEIALRGEESLARTWVEAWRSDIVCTTFVQVVNSLFHGTCADARRLTKLAGSILILDEVQAFPAELWAVLRVALRSLATSFGTDILLVTATQPALFAPDARIEIGPSGLHTQFGQAFDRYDVTCRIDNAIDISELAATVRRERTDSERCSCLVILNTVRESLELHQCLADDLCRSGISLFYLSTNLRPKDRQRILSAIRSCNTPHIVVATQVVEAGVDLSFETVFRALAPLDSIVQAAGRCNRHAVDQRGVVHVFDLAGATANVIYGNAQIGTARDVLTAARIGGTLRFSEPEFRRLVDDFFERLNQWVLGSSKANAVFDAVRTLQFAALRGEGMDRNVEGKRVQLIDDQSDRVSHFIETDEADRQVWIKLIRAFDISDRHDRRKRLRTLRNEIGQRVVDVHRRFALHQAPDKKTGFVHIPIDSFDHHYDLDTGWRHRQ